ncbi:MAG: hypothetical protein J7L15_02830 [Clostridiales bacterium]|nr:hypothetical protein [Clostridiales bacterium]
MKYNTFIRKANLKHNNKYTYNKTKYIDGGTKVTIICPIHGEFMKSPYGHLAGQGCQYCSGTKLNNDIFIEKSNQIYNNKYTYNKTEYIDSKIKVIITCPIHGDFSQIPNNHLNGLGCRACGVQKRLTSSRRTTEEFVKLSKKMHFDKNYSYLNTIYFNSYKLVTIICPTHGNFKLKPKSHLAGVGCPVCSNLKTQEEKYKNKETMIYYIFLPEYNLYKIGITKYSVQQRFAKEIKNNMKIEVISSKIFQDGLNALELEQQILSKYNQYQYKGPKVLYGGNTELFVENILKQYMSED